MILPGNCYYTRNHEWIRLEGENAYIGITEHIRYTLGDIVLLDLPEPGTRVIMGETIGIIEAVKSVCPILSPVNGTIINRNETLEDSVELLNQDPYTHHIAVIKMQGGSEVEDLMDKEEYETHCLLKEKESSKT